MEKSRRVVALLLLVVLAITISGCGKDKQAAKADFKVGVVTGTVSQGEDEYRAAEIMKERYGDRVIHVTYPDNFMQEQETTIGRITELAADSNVKAIVVCQGVPGTSAAFDKVRRTRDDILLLVGVTQEDPKIIGAKADIVFDRDELERGKTIPKLAKEMGAKKFLHYSFPRHMSIPLVSQRKDIFKEECKALGIEFIDISSPDPMGPDGIPGTQKFILEDVPKMVAKYGKDTAFFSTNCAMQIPLIKAVVDSGAIYPQPCCPSPYHGFPTALGIESDSSKPGDLQHVIAETKRILAEKGMSGRLSTWPVPVAMMSTVASTEYAFKVMAGEVPFDKLDIKVLEQCMSDYAKVDVKTSPYVDEAGKQYDNYLFVLMDFLTY
jgi:hypothetical protein